MAPIRKDPRTANARRLRREATPAEKCLWLHLKQMDVSGGHFRRQAPMGPYFADFVHFGAKLVVELDGGQHGLPNAAARDARRTAYLAAQGFRVIRFWNHELTDNLDGVVETIFRAVHDISNRTGDMEC
ncbi:endonuclease domain-containing protein [Bosea sp. LjRoot237]|uniref:endonuclease domain-containing protein n=1 Tax=Bosea sp. LjRoot237 TaxID=3342292 RepID=UPI003ECE03A6